MDKNSSSPNSSRQTASNSFGNLGQEPQQAQAQQSVSEINVVNSELASSSSPLVSEPPSANSPHEENVLQNLLADLVFASGRQPDLTPLEQKVARLEHQIHDPEEIIKLLMPVISELLNRKVAESKEGIIRAIVPIIDQILIEKTIDDKKAMIAAISNLIPGAIAKQVRGNPEDLIDALAPAMGEMIKQQIRLERDSMVDALYPVIGSTISKYMQEVVQEINSRVESTLTPQGIRRKLRAKMQGVSVAELILQESMPFQVEAVFLIHKSSGLIIASSQKREDTEIEEDLMAGMLTAIRSFAAECVVQGGNQSELKEIEYENFNIVMEVAGYCYLATIIQGNTEPNFVKEMRQTLGHIILQYDRDRSIHDYAGDSSRINPNVHRNLKKLVEYVPLKLERARKRLPLAFFLLLFIPLVIWGGFSWSQQRQEKVLLAMQEKVNVELDVDPQLAVYPIQAALKLKRKDHLLLLTGKIPSQRLKTKAAKIAQETIVKLDPSESWQVVNEIVAVELAPDPEAIAAEVERLTLVLNQDEDLILKARYDEPQVTISGQLRTEAKLQKVINAYSQIPGVKNVLVASTSKEFPIDQQIYFSSNSATVNPNDMAEKFPSIEDFLRQYPQIRLKIIGYVQPTESKQTPSLASKRAIAVRDKLISMGIKPQQLAIEAAPSSPPNLTQADEPWLSRSVRFERIID